MEWKTPKKKYSEIPQVTDSYVVHARGFTVGNDIWFDYYALNKGHKFWWNSKLQDEYGFNWDHGKVLYWSITGSESFIIQYPRYEERTEEDIQRLNNTLDALEVSKNCNIVWASNDDGDRIMIDRNDVKE